MAGLEIRRLSPDQARVYGEIRLEGLAGNPEAFGSTFERESVQSLAWFEDRLSGADIFGAFCRDELIGIAGFVRQQGSKYQHKGILVGMYVRPAARRSGAGHALLGAILLHSAKKVEILQLCVIVENETARHLYRSHGFLEYGI